MDVWEACRSGDINNVLNVLQTRDAGLWSAEALQQIVRAQLMLPATWPNLGLLRRMARELGTKRGFLLDAFFRATEDEFPDSQLVGPGGGIMQFFVEGFGRDAVLQLVAAQQAWFALAAMPDPIDRLGFFLEYAHGHVLTAHAFEWGTRFALETSVDRLREYAQTYADAPDPFAAPFSRLTRGALLRDALERRRSHIRPR